MDVMLSRNYYFFVQGTTVVENLLDSEDIHYMLEALKTLGLRVEDDKTTKKAVVEGSGGLFPTGRGSNDEVNLFLGNAGTAMRPLTAALVAAGGNTRFVVELSTTNKIFSYFNMKFIQISRFFFLK
jgi:5-enolpyruvylshikimate-3-phosphate synthase